MPRKPRAKSSCNSILIGLHLRAWRETTSTWTTRRASDAVECRCRVAPRRQPEADAHGSNQCSWACVRADLRVASCSLRAVLERTPNEIGALGDRVRLALRILLFE